jgi:hypothetical protein
MKPNPPLVDKVDDDLELMPNMASCEANGVFREQDK